MKALGLALSLLVMLGFARANDLADDKPINKKCPVSGKDIADGHTTKYKEKVIGFCCDNCKGKFEKEPEKYAGKIPELKDKKAAEEIAFADDPINKKCPISGKDVDAKQTSTYKEQVIGFCCGNCKEKFDKEPEKYIGKVKEFKKK